MKLSYLILIVAATLLSACAPDAPTSTAAMGEGHCILEKINEDADNTAMCVEPMDAATCETLAVGLGEASMGFADYTGGTFVAGSCPTDGVTASCNKEDGNDHYYGDTTGMDMGCKFSGGEWVAAEA